MRKRYVAILIEGTFALTVYACIFDMHCIFEANNLISNETNVITLKMQCIAENACINSRSQLNPVTKRSSEWRISEHVRVHTKTFFIPSSLLCCSYGLRRKEKIGRKQSILKSFSFSLLNTFITIALHVSLIREIKTPKIGSYKANFHIKR